MFSVILALIFFLLGSIHFYWLFGGKWGLSKALPTKKEGEKALNPPLFATLLVGFVLLFFSIHYGAYIFDIFNFTPPWFYKINAWFIPIIFMLRAIGDFRYVGFFKKIKHTEFAQADSRLFSPLCLFIGISGLILVFSL
jgi:hypothetical protein